MSDPLILYPGNTSPLGLSFSEKRANFVLFSHHASQVFLGLKIDGKIKEMALNRTGDLWHIGIENCPLTAEYAFRIDGVFDEQMGHLFNPNIWLADPVSYHPASSIIWGKGTQTVWSHCKPLPSFDWQGVSSPRIPLTDLIIYEMHVRGFTRHSSSQTAHPGTYLGITDSIPYLRKLGVNAIELMPIFEFDEMRCQAVDPKTKLHLVNYWGYDPLYFFSPMRRYAASDDAINEFRTMVRELHKNGIEVLLDVVYNHTGEGKEQDSRVNFRGIDNAVYYMIDEQGHYRDFSGCGNTFNINHPSIVQFILQNLRFWIQEMGVDGFRFDLASILTRSPQGRVLKHPPILQAIASDPVCSSVKLIAESWDAAGLYQVGTFPTFGAWSEWNGPFRDRVRNFIKGTNGCAGKFADVLCGSEFLYHSSSPLSSINFVTAHDGFTLRDLVSYNQKHNLSNGEMNRDGSSHCHSWNCGIEGPTDDPAIAGLRERQMRNFFLALFLAQGIPMLLMGDEYGHTRQGNNNPYVQDNEINWFLWDQLKKKESIFGFVSALIAFRKTHPSLHHTHFLRNFDIDWHGHYPFQPDWSESSRLIAYSLYSETPLYIAFNANHCALTIYLPEGNWHEVVRTDRSWNDHHLLNPKTGPLLGKSIEMPAHSALLGISL